jgi:hypothetical protein
MVCGYNPTSRKYFGAQYSLGKNKCDEKFIKKFLRVYGLVGRDALVVRF